MVELLRQKGFTIPEAAIREGLKQTRWPGRLEQVPQDPRVLLDGAHNPAAALALAQNLRQSRMNGRVLMVLGVMADKDVDAILARLLPLAQTVIFTQPRYFRAATPNDLAARAQEYGLEVLQVPQVAEAVRRHQPPGEKGRQLRIYYATQASVSSTKSSSVALARAPVDLPTPRSSQRSATMPWRVR